MKQENVAYPGELELIARARQGDAEAFGQLVAFYEPKLLAYLTRMLSEQESARDLVQETLLAAYRGLARWQPPAVHAPSAADSPAEQSYVAEHPLAPWLYRIATNLALNYLKGQPSGPGTASRQWMEPATLNLTRADPPLSLEDRYITRELLREALSYLSREDATCLLLRFVSGERYADIAARLGMSKEAVRKRVGRGLATLRAVYQRLDMEVSQ